MFPILFTSVGRRVELMRYFRRALDALQLEGPLLATDIDVLAPAFQIVDRGYLVPRVHEDGYIDRLVEICEHEQVRLVLPLIDPDIPRLAAARARFEAVGTIVGVVPAEGAAICSDKWKTYQFFQQLGLATPQSWLPEQIKPAELTYPVFLKPRNGSASENAFVIRDAEELAVFCRRVPFPIIQELIEGDGITCDVLCDFAGERVVSVVCRKRIAVRGGEAIKSVTVSDLRIQEACCEIARALGTMGPITVQCIVRDETPYFIEINGRLGGGLPLAIAAGADFPSLCLALASGLFVPTDGLIPYEEGVYMTRCDESYFLRETDRAELASHSIRLG
jgi:carbamoyl-phosphate synthase large subunit